MSKNGEYEKKILKLSDLVTGTKPYQNTFVGLFVHDSNFGKSVMLFTEDGQPISLNKASGNEILKYQLQIEGTKFTAKFKLVKSFRYKRSYPVLEDIHIIATLPKSTSQSKLTDDRPKE